MNTPEVLSRRPPDVAEVHVIWMTTGLGCDGDSVSVTAASLPSIEDVVMGNILGLLKVHCTILSSPMKSGMISWSIGSRRRQASWILSFWCSKDLCRTKESKQRAIGRQWERIPIQLNRSPPMNG